MGKKPEKLKPIRYDVIEYIFDEIRAIKTERDRELILGYTEDRLKFVNWYLELLDCNSKNYIVPQTYLDLKHIQKHLQMAIGHINDFSIPPPKGTIDYPEGYEG